jgi:hypothetical protein
LSNLAARVVWDNLDKYPDLDPELVQQIVDFGMPREFPKNLIQKY